MRRRSSLLLLASMPVLLLVTPSSATSKHGQHITDSKYSISFYLPTTWKHPTISTATVGTTKLLIQELIGLNVADLIQIQVTPGRYTNATDIAGGLLQIFPGAKVLSSNVAAFSFGRAEQLRFSIQSGQTLVSGTAEAFYQNKRTYVLAFDSTGGTFPNSIIKTVMNSWGT